MATKSWPPTKGNFSQTRSVSSKFEKKEEVRTTSKTTTIKGKDVLSKDAQPVTAMESKTITTKIQKQASKQGQQPMSSKESKSVTTKVEKKEIGKGTHQVTTKQTSTGSKVVGIQDNKSVSLGKGKDSSQTKAISSSVKKQEDVKGGKLVTTSTEQKTTVGKS